MSELFEPSDEWDRRLVTGARGILADFNAAGVLEAADVHVAARVSQLVGAAEPISETVQLALALAVRAVRRGSVCVALDEVGAVAPELAWPEPVAWVAEVAASPLVTAAVPPLRLEGELLYLDRYWREEQDVCARLVTQLAAQPPPIDVVRLDACAERVFPAGFDQQRAAARAAAERWTTVITGGPGTGKTTAVAGLLAMLADQAEAQGTRPRIALTAPTGKAAARLREAVVAATAQLPEVDRARLDAVARGGFQAETLHRLLGWRPGARTRFKYDRSNRLPHDVVVCDETSMVSLTMMARLLEALRPEARLVLVGDADQLASVEAGAVLSDLVGGLAVREPEAVRSLTESHRFGAEIARLAEACRRGDADEAIALLRAGGPHIEFWEADPAEVAGDLRAETTRAAEALVHAAETGDSALALRALDEHRLLCAHRSGPYGAATWNRQIERWLGEAIGQGLGSGWGREWYAGRPVMVSANDYGLGLYNGDTGITVRRGDGLRVAIAAADGIVEYAPSRLVDVETMHAMTVHKSQGSEARAVTVLLPPEDSRLATRELFYTAITRAQQSLRVVGSEAALRAAIGRRAQRASGLRQRLAT